jgi:glutaminyl-peptide cyclotransferase
MKKPRRAAPDSPPRPEPHKRLSGQAIFLWASVAVSGLAVAALASYHFAPKLWAADGRLKDIPFDGERAYGYLKQLCDLGPRPSGTTAMTAQQDLLKKHFEKLGAKVELQPFEADYPADGPDETKRGHKVPMVNIIVRWNPEARERVMICGHYDTLPFPLMDKVDTHGRFVGANDNASGVALLMELGNEFAKQPPKGGVDFVFLDGEEFIFDRHAEAGPEHQPDSPHGQYFWGSEHFAKDYADHPPAFHYRAAVLLDMVGGTDLELSKDFLSMSWSDGIPVVNEIWATAARLGVREFVDQTSLDAVTDDHLALHDVAKIPACDLIDVGFMQKQWHTRDDTPEHCSALSLAKVGWVLREWLRKQ